jgi:hypothetical protein
MATLNGSPGLRHWNIFAVRALIFGAFLIEGMPSILLCIPTLLVPSVQAIGLDGSLGNSIVIVYYLLMLVAAQCSFMLAIRATQQIARDSVSAREWGISGFFSANFIPIVGSLLFADFASQVRGIHDGLSGFASSVALQHLAVFLVVVLTDFFFCLFIDQIEKGEYHPSYSVTAVATDAEKAADSNKAPIPDLLGGIRDLLDQLVFHDTATALSVVRRIPGACPFERTFVWRGKVVLSIPPLCKLNPLFPEIQGLRFRALTYLADEGIDVADYL